MRGSREAWEWDGEWQKKVLLHQPFGGWSGMKEGCLLAGWLRICPFVYV